MQYMGKITVIHIFVICDGDDPTIIEYLNY